MFYMWFTDPLSFIMHFIDGFTAWLNSLTFFELFLIFWPLIIFDLARPVGKCLILLSHALYQRLTPRKISVNFCPKVSIIIPAHNEEKIIVRAIEAALETDYWNKEIIVVDDGSRDKTYELSYPYAKKGLIKLFRRKIASGSKAGAVNFGLKFATGDIIITVDADTLIERYAIKELIKLFINPNIGAVSGNVKVLRGEHDANNLLVKLQACEYLTSLELGRRFNALTNTLLIVPGAFGAFWRKNIASMGEYDSDTITEDFDITLKVRKLGKKIAFAEKAVAWTFTPETWRDWKRQRIRWARGQIENLFKHRNIFFSSHFDLLLILAVYDMVLMDILLLFVRFEWFIYILTCFPQTLIYIMPLTIILYLIIDYIMILTAGIISPRKSDIGKTYLAPIMTLFYRPYYSIVRFEAYLEWILKKRASW